MDARTWSYGGRDWPYDDETSAEIDERVARAKEETSPSDLERYETEVFAPTIETSDDPSGIAISDPEWAL